MRKEDFLYFCFNEDCKKVKGIIEDEKCVVFEFCSEDFKPGGLLGIEELI